MTKGGDGEGDAGDGAVVEHAFSDVGGFLVERVISHNGATCSALGTFDKVEDLIG